MRAGGAWVRSAKRIAQSKDLPAGKFGGDRCRRRGTRTGFRLEPLDHGRLSVLTAVVVCSVYRLHLRIGETRVGARSDTVPPPAQVPDLFASTARQRQQCQLRSEYCEPIHAQCSWWLLLAPSLVGARWVNRDVSIRDPREPGAFYRLDMH
jgi:hypothetical protein